MCFKSVDFSVYESDEDFFSTTEYFVCSSSTILDDKPQEGSFSDHDEALQSAGLVVKIMSNTRSEA